jgi:hypothetical protein
MAFRYRPQGVNMPTPEAIPAQELPTVATAQGASETEAATALTAQSEGSSATPTALTAQPIPEIDPPQ